MRQNPFIAACAAAVAIRGSTTDAKKATVLMMGFLLVLKAMGRDKRGPDRGGRTEGNRSPLGMGPLWAGAGNAGYTRPVFSSPRAHRPTGKGLHVVIVAILSLFANIY